MTQVSRPPKEQVRELMERHAKDRTPPLTPEQFRQELGWKILRDEEATRR